MKSEVKNQITDPWHHSQSWQAHGHQWRYIPDDFNARYKIESDRISLKIPTKDTINYSSPQAWLDKWAKSREVKKHLHQPQPTEQPTLFSAIDDRSDQTNEQFSHKKNPKGISFGKTLDLLYNGKTCTRRVWSDRTVKTFIKYYEEGIKVPALSKSFRNGGEIVGWLKLTQKPYQDELINMTQADLAAEGFPNYTFDQFINEFFEGKNQTVWVIWFEFTPNGTTSWNPDHFGETPRKFEEDGQGIIFWDDSIEPPDPDDYPDIPSYQKAWSDWEQQQLIRSEDLDPETKRDNPDPTPETKSKPITVEVVDNQSTESQELTDDEVRDLLFLERKVERAFYEAGKALQELRDRRLYRSTHKTFEEYCSDRFAFTRRRPYQLIDASIIVDNLLSEADEMCTNRTQIENPDQLTTNGTQNDEEEVRTNRTQNETDGMCTNRTQILPTSEWQVRPLTSLEPDQQREAWRKAVEEAGGKVPSGRIVKSIVDQIRERTKTPNPWRVNEVATIIVKDNPELRGKGGCWAVITEVHNFSCTVRLWDGEYQVKLEHLKAFPYAITDKDKKFFLELCDRLSKLYNSEMEETAKAILFSLGKIDRPWLTELEERVLRVVEGS